MEINLKDMPVEESEPSAGLSVWLEMLHHITRYTEIRYRALYGACTYISMGCFR